MAIDDDKNSTELTRLRAEVKRLRKALSSQSPDLETMLKRRGFKIYKKEPAVDILIPAKKFLHNYYGMLHKYSFRLFLRDVIKHREFFTIEEVARYATPAKTREYVDYLLTVKLIKKMRGGYVLDKGPVTSFGETLEWYIAELFKQEFGSEAVWGVKFKRPRIGGDYDVIAKIDGSLLYAEAKSSPPKQVYAGEIAAFLDRVEDLSPAVAVFLMDTELRMKDKLVPMFEHELRKRYQTPPAVLRMERELFRIQGGIFIVNAKETILQNIGNILAWYFRREQPSLDRCQQS